MLASGSGRDGGMKEAAPPDTAAHAHACALAMLHRKHVSSMLALGSGCSWSSGLDQNFLRIFWGSDFGFSSCAAPTY